MKIIKIFSTFIFVFIASEAFADATAYPNKPIKIVVSFTPGGTTDILSREVATQLSARWKVPVIVENKPGAAGNLGTEIVGRSVADGYTLLTSSIGPISINPTLFKNLAVSPQKSLQPVALLGEIPSVLVVPSNTGVTSWKDFLAYTKANKDALSYSSTGIGTGSHLFGFLFLQKTNMEAIHIPYKGAEATRDLVAGRVSFMFATAPSVVQLIKAGQLSPIAISSKKRISALPNTPTLKELGVDLAATTWFGIFAPSGINPEILQKLNATIMDILMQPEMNKKLAAIGVEPVQMNASEFANYLQNDFTMWAPIVQASGAKPE